MPDADELAEQVSRLQARVHDLETSQKALWAWARTFASQDSMLLTLLAMTQKPNREWVADRDGMIDQILDNDRKINDLPADPSDE